MTTLIHNELLYEDLNALSSPSCDLISTEKDQRDIFIKFSMQDGAVCTVQQIHMNNCSLHFLLEILFSGNASMCAVSDQT